jgi:hypothetical protein
LISLYQTAGVCGLNLHSFSDNRWMYRPPFYKILLKKFKEETWIRDAYAKMIVSDLEK